MSTTGRSESMNSFFDGYFTRTTAMIEFAKRHEDALRDRNLGRVKKDVEPKNQVLKPMTNMPIEAFALETYSLYAYEIFKEQMMISLGYSCVETSASSLIVQHLSGAGGEHVNFDRSTMSSNCPSFQQQRNTPPPQYVLKRWRWNTAPPVVMASENSLAANVTATANTFEDVTLPESNTPSEIMTLQNPQLAATKCRPKGRHGRLKAHHEIICQTCGLCQGKGHDRRTCSSRLPVTSNTGSTLTSVTDTDIESIVL
ncbi:hypothetical protein K3495_g7352 [Podosphaera aphanis]|nr:hypothetical protein K3495_g7352 [Podosphaera aphanis]